MSKESPEHILEALPYLRQAINLISDKWIVAVLCTLASGTKCYGELQQEIGSILQRMLTRTL